MICREETGFLVLVAHRTEVAPDDLKFCILANVVLCHLKHAEMEVCDGAEGAACDEDDGLLLRIAEDAGETVDGEGVVGWVRELGRRRGRGGGDVGRHG